MEIIETPVFTKAIVELLPDDDYSKLQHFLVCKPDAGALISGSGGLRKLRWSLPGRGKRGGIRTIYYWDHAEAIYMLLCYQKNEQENLTPKQLATLRRYVKEYLV
jgi:hypothetical protein